MQKAIIFDKIKLYLLYSKTMEHKRLFISLPVDLALAKSLSKQMEQLDLPLQNLRLVKPENMHITLKFLGDTSLDKLDSIINSITQSCKNYGIFELEIDQAKIFPITDDESRPARVLNLSFKYNQLLQDLYDKIEDGLWQDGLAHKNIRRFMPHITLARVKNLQKLLNLKIF